MVVQAWMTGLLPVPHPMAITLASWAVSGVDKARPGQVMEDPGPGLAWVSSREPSSPEQRSPRPPHGWLFALLPGSWNVSVPPGDHVASETRAGCPPDPAAPLPMSPSRAGARGMGWKGGELERTQGRWSGWAPEMGTILVYRQTSTFSWCHRQYSWIHLKEGGKYVNRDCPAPTRHQENIYIMPQPRQEYTWNSSI